MKARYRSHITYVKSVVPAENLLIWNVKQGWEPLCKFLNVPVPQEPLPRKNTKGELFHDYSKTPFVGKIIQVTKINFLKIGVVLLLLSTLIYYLCVNIL